MKAALAAAAVACLLSGCSSGETPQAPPAPTSTKAINSTLLTLTMPPGTKISSHADGLEIWQTPGSREEAIAALKPQLPIGRVLEGAAWCPERTDPATGSVDWRWAGPRGVIDVDFGSDGSIRIERITGVAGCGAR